MKLRSKDIDIAKSTRNHDPVLNDSWVGAATEMKGHYRRIWAKVGVKPVFKSSRWGRLSRMTTTYYKQVRLGTNYKEKSIEWQAVVDAHETVHVKQWRQYGRNRFRTNYIFSARFRWAVEIQAYCESVRALVALGASNEMIHKHIQSRPKSLYKNYALRMLNRRQMTELTLQILSQAWSRAQQVQARRT